MATNRWIQPAWTQVPQSVTLTITAVGGNTDTWTLTLTDDDGATAAVTYQNDGSPTLAEIGTGLAAAWAASTHPLIARITATNPSTGVCKLTANTAGIPFSVALTNNGTGTSSSSTTTANIGNNDASLARNWSLNAVLANSQDVVFEPGSIAMQYGLNQSAVSLATMTIAKGFNGDIGVFEFGKFKYFRAACTSLDYRGGGSLAMFDIGSSNISPYIESYGSPSALGRNCVYIKGSNIATLRVAKGNIGVAPLSGDTATVATILCGLLDNPQSDVSMIIGSGVTLTAMTQAAGTCVQRCAASGTVLVSAAGTWYSEGTGTISRLDVYGTAYPKSSGTITDLYAYGSVDFSRDRATRTVTNMRVQPGCTITLIPQVTVTNWIFPTTAAGAGAYNIVMVP